MREKSVYVLLIDAGNSRLKWRLLKDKKISQEGVLNHIEQPLPAADIVYVASVVKATAWQAVLEQRYGSKVIWWHQPQLEYTQFKHCYSQPERLGVDRWLAMLGGRKYSAEALLVVDAGTALTVDLLDEHNQHLGGYIVPGLRMAEMALFQQTDKVKPYQDELAELQLVPGQNTLSCVRAGVAKQRLNFVQALCQEYPQHKLLISGGDGESLAYQIKGCYYSNLVLDGMEMLCVGSL